MSNIIVDSLNESIMVKQRIVDDPLLISAISRLADCACECISRGGKLLICGNGGSASDALHMAGEIIGRFQRERRAWPAVALSADVATMTSIGNDYGFEDIFARQVEGLMAQGDVVLGISTSGNSKNVRKALQKARALGGTTAALLGGDGGAIGREVDFPVVVPYNKTARIQESHIAIIHIVCEIVENALSGQ